MELMEKNHEWISDGTYLAFNYFMLKIVPEVLKANYKSKLQKIYIPISDTEYGVIVNGYNLGRIYYHEFLSYVYSLPSYAGFRFKDPRYAKKEFLMPFDHKKLCEDCDATILCEDYPIYNSERTDANQSLGVSESFASFTNAIPDILKSAYEGKYKIDTVLDLNGIPVHKVVYLSLIIKNDNLFIGGYNLGKINTYEFLKYLSSLPWCYGKCNTSGYEDEDYEMAFNLQGLYNYYCQSQNLSRTN